MYMNEKYAFWDSIYRISATVYIHFEICRLQLIDVVLQTMIVTGKYKYFYATAETNISQSFNRFNVSCQLLCKIF